MAPEGIDLVSRLILLGRRRLMEPIENYELAYGGMAVSKTGDKKTSKPCEEITYAITVCNNVSPAPVNVVVEDIFTGPVELVSASPTADVTDSMDGDLFNRVEASGGYNGDWVNATNFSTIDRGELCCLPDAISATMTGRIDADDPKRVNYNLTIRNEADTPSVVAVTDHLLDGMRLVGSEIPFSP